MKKLKIATIILAVILISLISFGGVYVQVQNRMENVIKNYQFGMNLLGYKQIRIEPVKEKESEEQKEITEADVAKTKQIIENRLKKFGAEDYLIRADKGSIVIELANTSEVETIISNTIQQGKFEIIDSESKEVLMTNDDINKVNVLYGSTETGTAVYLNIEFDEEGTTKFEDITKKYATIEKEETEGEETTTEETTTEETKEETTEEEVKQPKVTLQIDGNTMISQSFDNPIENGKIQLSFNKATTDTATLQNNIKTASIIAVVLSEGMLPIAYTATENDYVYSDITNQMLMIFEIVVAIIILIALIVMVIKYKGRGFVAGALYVGLVAIYLLILRYTNVMLTIEGIAGILVVLIIHYIVTLRIVANKAILQEDPLPLIIAIVAFCLMGWASISSFGMVMFWGAVMLIYHMMTAKLLKD